MSKLIDETNYFHSLRRFIGKLKEINSEKNFDAIVAPKRSGLFLGVWASHALGLPMFLPAELRSMPSGFANILVVDTAIYKGKTLKKISNQLKPCHVFSAVIWREGAGKCDFVLEPDNIGLIKFFYEV